jgi:hypothetical protein
VYQYDPWNRLVEVNQAGSLIYDPDNPSTDDFDDDGKIHPNETNNPVHEIGDLVVRFQYDGLGRLMLAKKVHSGSPPNPSFTKEHYYYDGVRRLQEVLQTPSTPTDQFITQHEYVYGPDYVDEFVLETYRDSGDNQQPLYILQDANFNVMALLDNQGAVVEQYQWEPYGLPATVDVMADPRPSNRLGHQGLFFYRFDSSDGFTPGMQGLYYNRIVGTVTHFVTADAPYHPRPPVLSARTVFSFPLPWRVPPRPRRSP